jgi:group II intron reverse transcriptase/maturase
LDIKGFFDSIPHELVERAVAKHTDLAWVRLYVGRWLRAPLERADGTVVARTTGTPQGGVISPLLANLFLHYVFDAWMQRRDPSVPFERYADDVIVHCRSKAEADVVLRAIGERFAACGLTLHPTKTRIVYCKDDRRRGKSEHVLFDFLSFTFRARPARGRQGRVFFGFLPAISRRAAQRIRDRIRSWHLISKTHLQWVDLAALLDPVVRGWWTYFGRFYPSAAKEVLRHVNQALVWWVRRKYDKVCQTWRAAVWWIARLARRDPDLLELWRLGVLPDGGNGRAG